MPTTQKINTNYRELIIHNLIWSCQKRFVEPFFVPYHMNFKTLKLIAIHALTAPIICHFPSKWLLAPSASDNNDNATMHTVYFTRRRFVTSPKKWVWGLFAPHKMNQRSWLACGQFVSTLKLKHEKSNVSASTLLKLFSLWVER